MHIGTNSMPRVEITFTDPQPTGVGDRLLTAFTVHNDTSDQLPAQRLQLLGDRYWRSTCSVQVPSIAPYSKCKPVYMTMRCRNTSEAANVPRNFTVRLEQSQIDRKFRLSFWTYTQALRDYSPAGLPGAMGADKFMILTFGLAGAGKSSFFNAVMTLMHEGKLGFSIIRLQHLCVKKVSTEHFHTYYAIDERCLNK